MTEERKSTGNGRVRRSGAAREGLLIGIDLGGTTVKAALIGGDGRVRGDIREQTRGWGDPNDVVAQLAAIVTRLRESGGGKELGAIGIGAAAQIEAGTGAVTFAPNLGWGYFPLKARLEETLGIPVLVTNDVRASAFAEWQLGAGRGIDDLVLVFVGTGIGGSVISGGRFITGHANTAGELGHTTVMVGGPKCRCYNYGCLEAVAGGWAIAQRAQELILKHRMEGAAMLDAAAGDVARVSAKVVAEAAKRGDLLAERVMGEVTTAMIAGCTSFANAFSPRRIVLGGGVIEGYPELVGRIEAGVKERALPAAAKDLDIVKAQFGNDAGPIGAAAMARAARAGRRGLPV